jgi:hypothetical protein
VTNYPDDADGAVLADLAARGVDMSSPLLIEFAVAAPDEASANAVAKAMRAAGYDTEICFDEGDPDEDEFDEDYELDPDDEEFAPAWTVFANVSMIPEYDELIRIQAELDRIAGPHGGKADGWGTMLE